MISVGKGLLMRNQFLTLWSGNVKTLHVSRRHSFTRDNQNVSCGLQSKSLTAVVVHQGVITLGYGAEHLGGGGFGLSVSRSFA